MDCVTANSSDIEVFNISLHGGNTLALNTAIADSVAKGAFVWLPAGDSAAEAISSSLANSSVVLGVSAILDTDGVSGSPGPATRCGADDTCAAFGNFGSVVDIAAPGVDVFSTCIGQSYAMLSGMRRASPNVAGAVALRLANKGSKPTREVDIAAVRAGIISAGISQIIDK